MNSQAIVGTQVRQILDFKAEPSWVLPSLQIIDEHQGDWKEIQRLLLKFAKSRGSEAKSDNIVSAYITPTLRNLRFVVGKENQLQPTSDGKQCLIAFSKYDLVGFLKRFGLQMIRVDESSGQLLIHMLRTHDSEAKPVSVNQLRDELFTAGHKEARNGTRVAAWVSFSRYLDLLRSVTRGVYINRAQYRAFADGEKVPSYEKFTQSIIDCYRAAVLSGRSKGSPYIPIPVLRERVCQELSITTFTFDEKMIQAVERQDRARIVLSTPMRRKEGGIALGKKYYYFVSVYEAQ